MKLQTTIPLQKNNSPIDYDSKVLLLGSCFVENIGAKLSDYKFNVSQNPFGILFQPLAIENLIKRALENRIYSDEEVFCRDEQWLCFDAHSELRATSQEALLTILNKALKATKEQLTNASYVIITLGTAWVYKHNTTSNYVANCHKVPQKEFTKELPSVDVISESLKNIISHIKKVNTKTEIIFTISPVRHLKDGFVENQQSKAHLITAIHEVINAGNASYFPSYEIMMDELRDYRFYAKDMVHPNALAVDYIWGKFKYVWIAEGAYKVMDEVMSIQKGLQHKPFNPNSESHQKFLKKLHLKKQNLIQQYPQIAF